MNSFAHGSYTIDIEGYLVITHPRGGFNESRIIDLRLELIEMTHDFPSWVLLGSPLDKAGLTPEAVEEIAKSYQIFFDHGCIAIALEIGFTFGKIFQQPPFSELPMPIYTGKDKGDLIDKLTSHLS